MRQAFRDEDKPMLEKQQAVIGNTELMDLSPVLLAIDAAGVQARRRLEKLMAEETIS